MPPPAGHERAARTTAHTQRSDTRRSASPLLAASLHVALHELLGVLLENVVDLVEELVEVLLDLLALLGHFGVCCRPVAVPVALRPLDLLLLLLGHVAPLHLGQHDALLRLVLPLAVCEIGRASCR